MYLNNNMQKTVYYLVHKETQRRLKYYMTLAGARIAQRSRNHRLGFVTRIERVTLFDNWEVEMCENTDGLVLAATYCIVEDTIDSPDLYIANTNTNSNSDNNANNKANNGS